MVKILFWKKSMAKKNTFWKSMAKKNTFWKSMAKKNTFWKSMAKKILFIGVKHTRFYRCKHIDV
jgi:hypothetical protein